LTDDGKAAFRHWAARPSVPPSIKDDLLVRLYALDHVDIEPLRADLMARLEHHRDRHDRHERLLSRHYPQGTAAPPDLGKVLILKLVMRHEKIVTEWYQKYFDARSAQNSSVNFFAGAYSSS